MIMKTKTTLLLLSVFFSSITYAQCISCISGRMAVDQSSAAFANATVIDLSQKYKDLNLRKRFYSDDQWKTLIQKKYLNTGYSASYVDNFKTVGYFRYNLADDQMEFLRNNKTYFLKKELGRKIKFTSSNTTYKVFELNGRLDYFLVISEGKNSLLIKQNVKYIKPKKSQNGYDGYRPANFLRIKDRYYIANGNKVIELPRNKKSFYNTFGKVSKKIQSYATNNKLTHKSLGDLKKIVAYYNTL